MVWTGIAFIYLVIYLFMVYLKRFSDLTANKTFEKM